MSAASGKTPHLWQGEWIGDEELSRRIESLGPWVEGAVSRSLDLGTLLDASDAYSHQLLEGRGNHAELAACLKEAGTATSVEIAEILAEMARFMGRENLEMKLRRELGPGHPFLPARIDYHDEVFEAWAPLGLLVHVAPANSPTVAPLSVVEGLLTGNLNLLKTSGSESLFPQLFLDGLAKADRSGSLRHFIVAARVSSSRKAWLERFFAASDGIAVWGGEEAVQSVRKLAPQGARIIEWGHKISFAYLTREMAGSDSVLEAAAREICFGEQQACSSPQCIYLETGADGDGWEELKTFGTRFARVLEKVSPTIPRVPPSSGEDAEITLVTELERQEACFGQGLVIEAPGREWRVLIDGRPPLAASPLYRTVWVKPLPRAQIASTLRPMRKYLQTVGLACSLADVAELTERMIQAGAVRVRRIGEMPGSYSGEAHDGTYALARYCRRVSLQIGAEARGISSFADLRGNSPPLWGTKPPVMRKAEFQEMKVDERYAHLFFKSGGSTGEPKLSLFTYDDYDEQMKIGAEGLYAAGLDPLRDRSMNLFFAGSLYGGFLSIFSALERLQAPQLPMAAQLDFSMVADSIVKNRANVLLGMPSYLIQLFERGRDVLKEYGGVKKVFYGGEHFNDAQRAFLCQEFGVVLIRSVGYGSVDTGPLGYQCQHCEGSVHHLHQRLQFMEILDLEKDAPAPEGGAGRLVFTARLRKGQRLERYDLGDMGRWVPGPCPCDRVAPRFQLLGRSGDVFRIGSVFLNYQKFVDILSERLGYAGPVQLLLQAGERGRERIRVRLSEESGVDARRARAAWLADYADLHEVVEAEGLLGLEVEVLAAERFDRTKGSGKLVRILDQRSPGK